MHGARPGRDRALYAPPQAAIFIPKALPGGLMRISGMDFDGPCGLHDLRDEPGVYIVLDRFAGKNGGTMLYCIDVGESDKVHSGVACHGRRACWKVQIQGAPAFAVRYTGDDGEARRRTERELRGFLSPPCGDR